MCFFLFFSFYFFLQFFLNLIILVYNIVLILPYIDLNPPWVYLCSPSWTSLPPPSPSHPYGSCQCTSTENTVSGIKCGWAIHFTYDLLHVSMPFSHIIPPSTSPTESKRLINTSVSLLLSCIQGYRYLLSKLHIYPFSSVQLGLSVVSDSLNPMNHSTPGLPVHHHLPEFTQTHVHRVGDAIQTSHPLSSPSPPASNPCQHQGLFQWVNSSHEVAKVLEFQLQHQSFQWTPRTDLL